MGTAICWFVNSVASPMEQEGQAIARGLRQRNPDLLDRLIEQYQYRLFRYLLFLTGNRETAEDLFQETWLRVLERGRQYVGKWEFGTWLFAIARHLVIDLQRRRQPRYVDLLEGRDEEGQAFEPATQGQPSAFELVERREESERMAASLAYLPAPYREVLVLRFQEDMALEEIAEVIGAPLSTVKSRLYRGLEAMRQFIAGGQS
jgi:RNA polymerase sigma-70 factor (ECF subfamily)